MTAALRAAVVPRSRCEDGEAARIRLWAVGRLCARPAESLLGEPRSRCENAAPAQRRLQHGGAARECVDGCGGAVAFEQEDNLPLADEHVVPLEPERLELERRPLRDEPPSLLGTAALDRHNDGHARPRHALGPEPCEQLSDLAEQPDAAQGGDQHSVTGVALEDDGLVAIDPLARPAPNLDRGQLLEPNPEPFRFTRAMQDEPVIVELEPAARERAVTGAPNDGVPVLVIAHIFVRQAGSFGSSKHQRSPSISHRGTRASPVRENTDPYKPTPSSAQTRMELLAASSTLHRWFGR